MGAGPELLLIGAVAAVGILHTLVPDHWVPITLIARQRGWSPRETARAALQAGAGHVLSTLLIAAAVWLAGVAVASRFGRIVDLATSLALVLFGGWVAVAAWRDLHRHGAHAHGQHQHHHHGHAHAHDDPGGGGSRRSGEPDHGADAPHHHDPALDPADDPLYAPLRGDTAVLTRHRHSHRHGGGDAHLHWHDHPPDSAHALTAALEAEPPLHWHTHRTTGRTALLLILGSSPMVEGIPAFFAASQYGPGLIIAMSAVFALSTITTYVLLCVGSAAGLQRLRLGPLERYGEVLSGAFIALVGVAFWLWPALPA